MARNNLNLENARIIFPNFSGKAGKFNNAGNRNFCVIIDDFNVAADLENQGWNIRYLRPKDPQEVALPYLQVAVSYDHIPPQIYMVRGNKRTLLDESEIGSLDWAEIKYADMSISPYNWTLNDRSGVKGYVKYLYVVIEEDPFEDKYEDTPTSGVSAIFDETR